MTGVAPAAASSPLRRVLDERGSASLEFATAGLLLLVPLVYLVLVLGALQGASLGVEGAARQAARVFARAESPEQARAEAERAIAVTLADYGLDAASAEVAIDCRPRPDDCLTRGGAVTVTVVAVVPLPLVPAALGFSTSAGVPVESSATQPVSRFTGAE